MATSALIDLLPYIHIARTASTTTPTADYIGVRRAHTYTFVRDFAPSSSPSTASLSVLLLLLFLLSFTPLFFIPSFERRHEAFIAHLLPPLVLLVAVVVVVPTSPAVVVVVIEPPLVLTTPRLMDALDTDHF